MNQFDHLKKKLEEEKERLEDQLKNMAQKNPHSGDWEPQSPDLNPMPSDVNEMSDVFEEIGNQMGIEYQLEERLKEVDDALERIKAGTFGICEVGGEQIEEERLSVNPSARTCKKHSK